MEKWSENGHSTRAVQATMALAFASLSLHATHGTLVRHPGHCVLLPTSPSPAPAVIPTTDTPRHSECDTNAGIVPPGRRYHARHDDAMARL